ncbi:MAG: TraB/GumN family protein [Candidatus Thermoplasmatota archaeon]|nr:TraB/GumN family protein [Candidatus Thermoplasmatota archaeon]
MITIVGVGHVFAISENVKDLIRSRRPEVVCLELDPGRYRALVHKEDSRKAPLQYRLLELFQKRMATKFGTEVGDEMVAAVDAAREVGAKVALIDMDAAMVFARLWKRMSFKEKMHLMGGAFAGLFASKERVEKELGKYEESSDRYMELLGEGFPSIKEVLIDDRNKFMAGRLSELAAQHASIVAVVGDGHVPGIASGLEGSEVETVRLKDLRTSSATPSSGQEFTTSFWIRQE